MLHNNRRWSNVLYLPPLKSGYLPLSSYIFLTCETYIFIIILLWWMAVPYALGESTEQDRCVVDSLREAIRLKDSLYSKASVETLAKYNAEFGEARRKQDSILAYIKSITPTIPQPRADAKPIDVKWNKNKVGQWDPATLKLTFDMTYDEGEYAGKNIQYQLDPQTGKWTNIAGNVVGQMSNDGTIETPNLGTIKLNTQNNKVVWNGEVIGEATKTSAIC